MFRRLEIDICNFSKDTCEKTIALSKSNEEY